MLPQYESVLHKLIEKTTSLSLHERRICKSFIRKDNTDWSGFRTTGMVAMLGEVFCDNIKDKNEWKSRMIKAGLGDNLQMPDDWDALGESEKEKRLDKVISMMGNGKV